MRSIVGRFDDFIANNRFVPWSFLLHNAVFFCFV